MKEENQGRVVKSGLKKQNKRERERERHSHTHTEKNSIFLGERRDERIVIDASMI